MYDHFHIRETNLTSAITQTFEIQKASLTVQIKQFFFHIRIFQRLTISIFACSLSYP